jgi:bifunctional non-homologous end joining protein LigD
MRRPCSPVIERSRLGNAPGPRQGRARPRARPLGSQPPLPMLPAKPCLPTSSPSPPSGPEWLHEIKHDGYRLLAHHDGERVSLISRAGSIGARASRRSLRPWRRWRCARASSTAS